MATKPRTTRTTERTAFTLVEMLVVVSIIVLILAVAIPSIAGLFTAGADAQAYNIIAAQLSSARALAIQRQTYAGVHVQFAAPSLTKLTNACFTAVVWDDPATTVVDFRPAPGFFPKRMTGGMTLGQISNNFYDNINNVYRLDVATNTYGFCSFTVVFTPTGQLAVDGLVYGGNVQFLAADPLFTPGTSAYLWTPPPAAPGVRGMVLFDGDKFLPNTNKPEFLRLNGQVIGVNWYTGAVLGR